MRIEQKIFKNLICDSDYTAKVLPFLKEEYFTDPAEQTLFNLIEDFVQKYSDTPTIDSLKVDIENLEGLSENVYDNLHQTLKDIQADKAVDPKEWLNDNTEGFCKEKAIYLALTESISIANDDVPGVDRGSIPEILSQALAVSFDTNVGHSYLKDWEERYDLYHIKREKFAFDLEMLNKITRNGVCRKTLNMVMGGSGAGKSTMLGHLASSYLMLGYNVLYVSMEMDVDEVSRRNDANLMNINLDDIEHMPKDTYQRKVERLASKTQGELKIKQFPSGNAHSGHVRALMNELRLKQKFKPDIVIVDYLNICASSRVKMGASGVNTYVYVQKIAEEFRALAIEENVVVWSATQTNRSGFGSSDPGAENISDSFGLMYTADLFLALVTTEELEELNQVMIKQLKNRYNPLDKPRRFVLGLNRSKMKFYDVEQSAQEDIHGYDEGDEKSKNRPKQTNAGVGLPSQLKSAPKRGEKPMFGGDDGFKNRFDGLKTDGHS